MAFVVKDSGQRKTFATGMQRDVQENKPRYDLVDMAMLTRWAEHMGKGALKYGERNWEKASTEEELNRFKASALRHMIQWFNGEVDEDHASAVFFNIAGAEMVKRKKRNARAGQEAQKIYSGVTRSAGIPPIQQGHEGNP